MEEELEGEAESLPWVGDEATGSRGWGEEQGAVGDSGWPGEEERWRERGNRGWEEDTQQAWADREVKRGDGRGRRSRWDTVEKEDRGRERRSREGSRGRGEDKESREDWGGSQQHNSTDWEAAARNWMQHQVPSTLDEPTPPELGSLLTRLGGTGTDSETEGSRKLDLDTRLQMLMKDKSANMPAFLIGSDSSEDEA